MTTIRILSLHLGRRFWTATLSVCLVAASTSTAPAQRRGSVQQAAAGAGGAVANAITGTVTDSIVACALGPALAIGQVMEVFNDITVNILRVPANQAEKLLSVNSDMKAKLDAFKALPFKERHEKLMAAMPALEKEYVARINEHLDAEQRVIFRNLMLNIHGPTSFGEPDVAAALALTKEQQAKVAETLTDSATRLKHSIVIDREFGALDIASILSIRKKRDTALLAVLTPEQVEAWNKLKGPPALDVEATIKKIVAAQLAARLTKPKTEKSADSAATPSSEAAPTEPAPAAPAAPPAKSEPAPKQR